MDTREEETVLEKNTSVLRDRLRSRSLCHRRVQLKIRLRRRHSESLRRQATGISTAEETPETNESQLMSTPA